MKSLIFGILAVLLVVLIGGYALRAYRSGSGVAAVGLAVPVASSTVSTANLPSAEVTLSGTAILDDTSGLPAVPFISYTDSTGRTGTKQLIYVNERGCFASAGDLPCVPPHAGTSAYPQVTTGQHITATGYIRDDRFLVTAISVENTRTP